MPPTKAARPVRIVTARFTLRELSEDDASERYLEWFRDADAQRYVSTTTEDLDELRRYVRAKSDRADVLFLGIFDKESGLHVGNLKFEPVDSENGYAIMGILVGDASYRGQGVASEVLVASGRWLKVNRGIRDIELGVHRHNHGAIRAYEKVGFRVCPARWIVPSAPDSMTMVWRI